MRRRNEYRPSNLALPPPLYFSQSPGLFVQKMRNHCRFCQQLSPPGLPPMGAEKRQGKEKKRLSRKKNDVEKKKKKTVRSPLRGRLGLDFFLTVFFLFLECLFFLHPASLFVKSTKIPSDRRWPTLFAVIPFFLSKIGVAGRFHFSLSGKMEAFVGLRAQ